MKGKERVENQGNIYTIREMAFGTGMYEKYREGMKRKQQENRNMIKLKKRIETEWHTALCSPHWQLWAQALSLDQYLWTHLQVCGSKRLGYHIHLYTVSMGEFEDHTGKRACKALKPRPDFTRSPKQGYHWPHEKNLCPPKYLSKKIQKKRIFTNGNTITLLEIVWIEIDQQ